MALMVKGEVEVHQYFYEFDFDSFTQVDCFNPPRLIVSFHISGQKLHKSKINSSARNFPSKQIFASTLILSNI